MKKVSILCVFALFIVCSAMAQRGHVEFKLMPCHLLAGIQEREYAIYLPAGYETESSKSYPILYLLHGGGCSHKEWQENGQLDEVADSLMRCGLAEEMIIVCPEGNKDNMIWFNAPHWKYEDYFFQEFVPYIESTYRVKADKEHRAVAGFSMGGGASVVYGVHHPEYFCSVYAMSSYLRKLDMEWLKNDPSAPWRQQIVEENNPMVAIEKGDANQVKQWTSVRWFIDCGDDDFTYDMNIDLIRAFRSRNIPYELRIKDGGHNWEYWKPAMIEAIKRAYAHP